jgi:hypothetical protein
LTVGCTAGDDHALKKGGHVLGVENHYVLGFDIFQAIHDGPLQFLNISLGAGIGHVDGVE